MKKQVLIIEDDKEIRSILAFILENEGFATLSIPKPELIDEVSQYRPDVILIDEFIHRQPGHRLCRQLKDAPHLQHIPVIVLSTSPDIEAIVEECQANDFVRKPFDVSEMVSKVIQVIESSPLIY